jgi:hypothetical protein
MTAKILDGAAVARSIKDEVATEVAELLKARAAAGACSGAGR